MYKLIIVDDEPATRKGLKDIFEWSKFDIEVIGEADDGETALPLIRERKPDIVITDVKMARMGGIELSKKLYALSKDIKVIFISGYDDVEYLKSALKVDAVDYILKPLNLKEFEAVIRKVVQIRQKEENQKSLIYNMNIKLMQSMPLLREKFLIMLVRDGINDIVSLKNRIDFLELELPMEGIYCVLAIHIDDRAAVFTDLAEKEKGLISFSILNICQELIDRHVKGSVFENREGEFVCILHLPSEEEQENLYTFIEDIHKNISDFLKIETTIGVGTCVQSLKDVHISYRSACDAAGQKLFLGKNRVITVDYLGLNKEEIQNTLIFKNEEKVLLALKAGDEEKTFQTIEDLFSALSSDKKFNKSYYHNYCNHLCLMASRVLMELEIGLKDEELSEDTIWNKILRQETLEDMKSVVISHFKAICGRIGDKRAGKTSKVIDKIKSVMDENYHRDITINDIAKEVFLASTYMCLIFKQETGETINEYLTKVRMEKAIELLKDYRNKLYDICYAIGYNDPGYFTRMFKKYTGMTPKEYRSKIM